MRLRPFTIALLVAATAPASAQVEPVAFDSFDYTYPGLLINANGGTGWGNPWFVTGNGNGIVIFADNGQHPPFNDDGDGNFAGQAQEWAAALRKPSTGGHGDVTENGKFGKDGGTLWLGWLTRSYQVFGDHLGGLYLMNNGAEVLLIGSPWGTYGWGVDDLLGNIDVIPGSDDALDTHIVVRIDYQLGQERLRMWLDPAVDHPNTAADLDILVLDHRWDEIRFMSGGFGSHQYWDRLMIDKGKVLDPPVGQNYCGPANLNSTGQAAVISATGSDQVAQNNLTLQAEKMAVNEFGYFLTSQTQGFVFPPGSQGFLCLGGTIARFSQQTRFSGVNGEFSLSVDLTAIPMAPPVAVQPGETWNFQAWFRDGNSSNFTDGLQILFQ